MEWKATRLILIADVEATRQHLVTIRQSAAQAFAMRSITVLLIAAAFHGFLKSRAA